MAQEVVVKLRSRHDLGHPRVSQFETQGSGGLGRNRFKPFHDKVRHSFCCGRQSSGDKHDPVVRAPRKLTSGRRWEVPRRYPCSVQPDEYGVIRGPKAATGRGKCRIIEMTRFPRYRTPSQDRTVAPGRGNQPQPYPSLGTTGP